LLIILYFFLGKYEAIVFAENPCGNSSETTIDIYFGTPPTPTFVSAIFSEFFNQTIDSFPTVISQLKFERPSVNLTHSFIYKITAISANSNWTRNTSISTNDEFIYWNLTITPAMRPVLTSFVFTIYCTSSDGSVGSISRSFSVCAAGVVATDPNCILPFLRILPGTSDFVSISGDKSSLIKSNVSEMYVSVPLTSSEVSQFAGLNISSATLQFRISSTFPWFNLSSVYRLPEVGVQLVGVSSTGFSSISSWGSRPKVPISDSSLTSFLKSPSGGLAWFDTVQQEVSVVNGSQSFEIDIHSIIQNGFLFVNRSSATFYLLLRVFVVPEVYAETTFSSLSSSNTVKSMDYSITVDSSVPVSLQINPFLDGTIDTSLYVSSLLKKSSYSSVDISFSNSMDGLVLSSSISLTSSSSFKSSLSAFPCLSLFNGNSFTFDGDTITAIKLFGWDGSSNPICYEITSLLLWVPVVPNNFLRLASIPLWEFVSVNSSLDSSLKAFATSLQSAKQSSSFSAPLALTYAAANITQKSVITTYSDFVDLDASSSEGLYSSGFGKNSFSWWLVYSSGISVSLNDSLRVSNSTSASPRFSLSSLFKNELLDCPINLAISVPSEGIRFVVELQNILGLSSRYELSTQRTCEWRPSFSIVSPSEVFRSQSNQFDFLFSLGSNPFSRSGVSSLVSDLSVIGSNFKSSWTLVNLNSSLSSTTPINLEAFLISGLITSPLIIPPLFFNLSSVYQYSYVFTYTSLQNVSISVPATMLLEAKRANFIRVSILSSCSYCSPSRDTVLSCLISDADVSSEDASWSPRYEWTCADSSNQACAFGSGFDLSAQSSSKLVLPSGSLSASSQYTFSVTAYSSFANISRSASSSVLLETSGLDLSFELNSTIVSGTSLGAVASPLFVSSLQSVSLLLNVSSSFAQSSLLKFTYSWSIWFYNSSVGSKVEYEAASSDLLTSADSVSFVLSPSFPFYKFLSQGKITVRGEVTASYNSLQSYSYSEVDLTWSSSSIFEKVSCAPELISSTLGSSETSSLSSLLSWSQINCSASNDTGPLMYSFLYKPATSINGFSVLSSYSNSPSSNFYLPSGSYTLLVNIRSLLDESIQSFEMNYNIPESSRSSSSCISLGSLKSEFSNLLSYGMYDQLFSSLSVLLESEVRLKSLVCEFQSGYSSSSYLFSYVSLVWNSLLKSVVLISESVDESDVSSDKYLKQSYWNQTMILSASIHDGLLAILSTANVAALQKDFGSLPIANQTAIELEWYSGMNVTMGVFQILSESSVLKLNPWINAYAIDSLSSFIESNYLMSVIFLNSLRESSSKNLYCESVFATSSLLSSISDQLLKSMVPGQNPLSFGSSSIQQENVRLSVSSNKESVSYNNNLKIFPDLSLSSITQFTTFDIAINEVSSIARFCYANLSNANSTLISSDILSIELSNQKDQAFTNITFLIPFNSSLLSYSSSVSSSSSCVSSSSSAISSSVSYPQCVWWDKTTLGWSTSGCFISNFTAITSEGASAIECTCSHLTDFAVLLQEFNSCGSSDDENTLTISYRSSYLFVYAIICAISFSQIFRLIKSESSSSLSRRSVSEKRVFGFCQTLASLRSGENNSLFFQHLFIALVCLSRMISQALFLIPMTLNRASLAIISLFLALPYLFLFWMFVLLLAQWFLTYHYSTKLKSRTEFLKLQYMSGVVGSVVVFSIAVITMLLISLLSSSTDQVWAMTIGSVTIASIYLAMSISFVVYAKRLISTLLESSRFSTQDTASGNSSSSVAKSSESVHRNESENESQSELSFAKSRKPTKSKLVESAERLSMRLHFFAVGISLCLGFESVLWIISSFETSSSLNLSITSSSDSSWNSNALSISTICYLFFECISLVLTLHLFSAGVSKAVGSGIERSSSKTSSSVCSSTSASGSASYSSSSSGTPTHKKSMAGSSIKTYKNRFHTTNARALQIEVISEDHNVTSFESPDSKAVHLSFNLSDQHVPGALGAPSPPQQDISRASPNSTTSFVNGGGCGGVVAPDESPILIGRSAVAPISSSNGEHSFRLLPLSPPSSGCSSTTHLRSSMILPISSLSSPSSSSSSSHDSSTFSPRRERTAAIGSTTVVTEMHSFRGVVPPHHSISPRDRSDLPSV
jgi:hypothetical protein